MCLSAITENLERRDILPALVLCVGASLYSIAVLGTLVFVGCAVWSLCRGN